MRLYTYLLKLQLLNALAYRFEYLSSIGRNLFFFLAPSSSGALRIAGLTKSLVSPSLRRRRRADVRQDPRR